MASELRDTPPATLWRTGLCALLLLAIVAAGLGLRLWRLADGDLTEDEELATSLPLLGYGELFTSIAGRPPLAFLAQKIVIDLAGGDTSAFTLRLAGVLEGSLAIAVLFALVRAVGGVRAGLLAAALLAVSAFHIEWSRDARYYPMLALAATVCLWGFWRGGVERKPSGYLLFGVGFIATALTHFSGYLFCAAVVASLPSLALLPAWRVVLLRQPKRLLGGLGALTLLALPVAWLLRGYLDNVTKHLAWPDLSKPLPPLFDVSPEFLWHRLGDALGLGGLPLAATAGLLLIGILAGARRSWPWAVLSANVLVLPFLLFYLFPPDHPWHIKYFIYQLPILMANLALGMDAIARLLVKPLAKRPASAWGAAVAAIAMVALPCLSNLARVQYLYAWPVKAHQELGADLAAWSAPKDRYYCTWKERPRILRHYCAPLNDAARLSLLDPALPFPMPLPPLGSAPWYLLDGKSETAPSLAAELLSGTYSRIPYENIFLARAPSLQQAPVALSLAPGESHTVSLLSPRASARTLLLDMDAAPGGTLTARIDEGESWTVRTQDRRRLLTAGRATLPRGPRSITLTNTGATPLLCHALALVPHIADDTPVRIPAWDFLSLTGEAALDTVWTEARPEGMTLRDLRHGHSAAYRIVNTQAREVVVRLHALNDPPLANRYQLMIANTRLQYEMLSLDREDERFSWVESKPFTLPIGDHVLYVGYVGMSREDFLLTSRNGRAQTEEALQNPGLLEIEIAPTGK